ncbi:MAG: hypothetical protein M3169_11435 [Candidatus Eremiobacteraeota bacterium]|nr:hypothetical protein [Candidatus Eremiobacteraeota bacterium]
MPMVHEIKIEPVVDKHKQRTGYRYVPQPPDPASGPTAARPGDQVFWRNDDTQAHWPGTTAQKTIFMPNQIAPNSSSQAWVADAPANPLTYKDTLDTSGSAPTGTIVVSSTAGNV